MKRYSARPDCYVVEDEDGTYILENEAQEAIDALESLLRESEAREAAWNQSASKIRDILLGQRNGAWDETCYNMLSIACREVDKIISTLPTRTAAVLAVLDAAREWKKWRSEANGPLYTPEFLLDETIRNLDKE